LGYTRFGVRAVRTSDGRYKVVLRAGFLRINLTRRLLSEEGKPKKTRKAKKKEKRDWAPFLRAVKPALSALRAGVRVDKLIFRVTVGGGNDPCDAALMYGRLWMAWGMLRPVITENLRVKKERAEIGLDFDRDKTRWEGELALTISLGRSIGVLLSVIMAMMKQTKTTGKVVQT
jgi:hypothetical protein